MEYFMKPFSKLGWSFRQPLSVARSHFGVVNYGARVYAFGGGGPNFEPLDSVEIYDPQSDCWNRGTPMPTRRSGITAVTVNNQIYVMGGGFKKADGSFEFLRTVEVYDPERDRWEVGPDLIKRHDAPSATLHQGRIYLFGGHHPEAQGGPLTDPAFAFSEVLDLDAKAWESILPMPTPRFSLTTISFGDRILAMGGGAFTGQFFTNFDRVEAYDPIKNGWEEDSQLRLPWPAAGVGACLFRRDLFIFGGNDGDKIQDRGAYFDTEEKKWIDIPPMPFSRVIVGVVVLGDDILIMGGRGPDGKQPVNSVMALTML